MSENLFRQKSLDHISSPEDMHNYMRVTGPRLWMLLSAISLLLIGFIVYASTTTIENITPVEIYVTPFDEAEFPEDYSGPRNFAYADLPSSYAGQVEIGMEVRLGERIGHVEWITAMEDTLSFSIDFGDEVNDIPVGTYEGEVVIESTTPISFLWN